MSDINPELARKIAAVKARMLGKSPEEVLAGTGGAAGGGGAAAGGGAPAAPADGGAAEGDMAAKVAAIKARMQGKSVQAPAAAAAAGTAAPAAASAATNGGATDMQARIAALKAKMEAGKGGGAAAPAAATATATATATAAPPKPARPKPAPRKTAAARNVFPVEPINRKTFGDERLYGDQTVNRWFVLGGLLLLVAVVLMWRRDHVRDWKPIQQAFREREIQRLAGEVAQADAALGADRIAEVVARMQAVEQRLSERADELQRLQEQQAELEGRAYASNQVFQIEKSVLDEMRYQFEELRLHHGGHADTLARSQQALDAQRQKVDALKAEADRDALDFEDAKGAVAELLAEQTDLGREREGLQEDRERLVAGLGRLGVDVVRTAEGALALDAEGRPVLRRRLFDEHLRNAPIADMLSPTLKVEKFVLDGIKDNYNFMYVDRVDMCTTCHVSIAKPEYADWDPDNSRTDAGLPGERVLNAHPRLDLFVSDSSPHPASQFGCTVCHLGRGQAVEFARTFHVPTADAHETLEQKTERWIRDWGYEPDRHYWDFPMTPSDLVYSSCWQCHQETDRLPGVPEYNASRALVEDLGCYGCHKIQGLEHLRKPGPDLTNVAAKTDEEWAVKWALSPQAFRPTTRMPHFWHQSNTGEPEPRIAPDVEWNNNSDAFVADWRARNETEANLVLGYIWEKSRGSLGSYGFELLQPPAREGDPEAGRELFALRGCLGCHSLGEDDTGGDGWIESLHGPELSSVGSKLDPQWLYSWILEPKKYFPTTVMPDLRLTEDEAWDITAFLMQQRDEEWEAIAAPPADPEIVDGIALEYLSSVAGDGWARDELSRMREQGGQRAVDLYAGGKLFAHYGCSGCHLVPDHYGDMGIGTELTFESLKELSKFDYGFEASHGNPEHIAHTREAWYRRKLTDPRVFDRLPVVAGGEIVRYDMKVKRPAEKLKMPNYYLDDDEVQLVVQFLVGLREDGLDASVKHTLSDDEKLVEEGSRLITQYNCIGCHRMGQVATRVTVQGDDLDGRLESLEAVVDDALEHGLWMAEPLTVAGQELFAAHAWLSDEFYDPSEEEDVDLYEWFEDAPDERPIPDELLVYGAGEGGLGHFIDDAALRPPVLRGEGGKADPQWLFEFLMRPYIVRPHVDVRMPTFGLTERESLALVRWFAAKDGQSWPFEPDPDPVPDAELLAKGAELFATFQCNSCHPAGDRLPTTDRNQWGPDLSLAAERLKTGWVHDWLWDPQQLQPGTRMPNFFGEFSDGEYDAIYGDYEERIRALQHYLRHLDSAAAADRPVSRR